MSYLERFIATDNLIAHLSPILSNLVDASIKANYAGFISVSAITVYELAIKDIFIDFSQKKNPVFGAFVTKHFTNINGKIKIGDLRGQHIKLFGDKYLQKFDKKLKIRESIILNRDRKSLHDCYENLITCRHKYVHGGNTTLSFEEVIDNYQIGKEVIHTLHEAMYR